MDFSFDLISTAKEEIAPLCAYPWLVDDQEGKRRKNDGDGRRGQESLDSN